METDQLKPVLEALLFAAESPVPASLLADAAECDLDAVSHALLALASDYDAGGRGVRLTEIAGGWQFLTREEYAPFLGRFLRGKKKMRLSRPALETLAIIAYRQPITKAEVDAIRGVDSRRPEHVAPAGAGHDPRRSKVVGARCSTGRRASFSLILGSMT